MKAIWYGVLAFCMTFTACGSTHDGKKEGAEKADHDQIQLPERFYKRMSGSIGESAQITMHFLKGESIISGNYYYDKIGIPLNTFGSIDSSGNIKLEERNSNGEVTGEFLGRFSSVEVFEGTWTDPKTKKNLPFRLEESTARSAKISFEDYFRENCENTKSPSQEEKSSESGELCTNITINLIKVATPDGQVNGEINKSISNAIWGEDESSYTSMEAFMDSVLSTSDEEYSATEYSFDIVTNDNDILCIDLSWAQYFDGYPPVIINSFLNYDLKSGNEINKKQLFVANYQTKLNQIGERLFAEANGNEEGVWEFTTRKFELNDNFAITKGGLLYHFNQYEIGPHSSGAPEVFIPYKEIENLILPGGYLDQIRNK